jgi:malonyl-CoA/methylmalonyl-CoA synthetase
MNANLFQHLSDAVADTDKVAIETASERITYGDLILASGRMANALQERGVNPGDRVAVQVEKSVPNLVLYLGCLRAGAVYLPLNTAYTLSELDYFIGDAEPALVVCDPSKREGIEGIVKLKLKGKGAVETLDRDGRMGSRMPFRPWWSDRTISPRSSTPRARPGVQRAPC